MMDSIRSEFRKLLTVRSTYIIVFISLAVIALFAGYGDGFKAGKEAFSNPLWLQHESFSAIVFAGLITAITSLLLFGHEYRYNSIMYTLTNSNNRLKSLLAKAFAISMFAVITSVLYALWSPLCTLVGMHFAHHTLVAQSFDLWDVLWRCAFVGWGYVMFAFIFVAIIRSQVGSIVMFLIVPLIGENILGAIFKSTQQYLPFVSLQSVAPTNIAPLPSSLQHYVVVSLAYIVGGLAVSAVLFSKRDAN
jgi:ABC-type transport system involved in multi-copper enzyme maturation permease subunit